MDEKKDILQDLAKRLFELFVTNRNAMALQMADGNYVTKYTRVTAYDIYCMLREGKAIGSYQQLYKSPYLKWVCFDFDCKEKENPNIQELFSNCTKPLNDYLDAQGINYINEFSGRRGIHTWILFDGYVTKQDAYNLIQAIKNRVEWGYDRQRFGLDEFPSTPSSKGNVIGKQVKIPISKHKKGGYSFFFTGDFHYESFDGAFFERQLKILNSVKLNNFEDLSDRLYIPTDYRVKKFTRTCLVGNVELTAEEAIQILAKTEVYRLILDRVMHGEAMLKDWLVMLGTLGKLGDGYSLLMDIFRYCPTFSEEETNAKIEKYGKKYFPATFSYLYSSYDLDMESWINPDETGLQFLVKNLGVDVQIKEWASNERSILDDSFFTLEKEKKYLFSNDEVPVVSIRDDLDHMTKYDTNKINETIQEIREGSETAITPAGYCYFKRQESETKERTMVSLSAYDRVLTSHIAMNVFYHIDRSFKSYSYNPNYISSDEMFYHWFSSWGNYLAQIRKYIEVDLYADMHVLTIDIKHFYDSIDFLGVYNLLSDKLQTEDNRLFMSLIKYNEELMLRIKGTRKGVPQGPAYARIIAEAFLGTLVEEALGSLEEFREYINLYRYVDDIIVFYDASVDGKHIYGALEKTFARHGLRINEEKSRIYGEIGKLNERQKAELLRSNQFQYGLRVSEYSFLTEMEYVKERLTELMHKKGGFNAGDLSFFFSRYSDERAKKLYFNEYAQLIMKCRWGRGSGYQLFYRYIFETPDILEYCIDNHFFELVPINTINFSCLLAIAFYAFEKDYVYYGLKRAFIDGYIKRIIVDDILEGEDKSIILSLSKLES